MYSKVPYNPSTDKNCHLGGSRGQALFNKRVLPAGAECPAWPLFPRAGTVRRSRFERAMITFLDHNHLWKGATHFYHADTLSSWRKRKNLPHVPAAVDDASLQELARLIRTYFHHTDGRGNNSQKDGSLDLNFRGSHKAVEPLQAIFTTAILKLPEPPPDPKDKRYPAESGAHRRECLMTLSDLIRILATGGRSMSRTKNTRRAPKGWPNSSASIWNQHA
jgi:hypothetical protein